MSRLFHHTKRTVEESSLMQGKVEIAGVNTSKLKVLKNEETMALLRRTKEGDQEARRQLIEGNLRLEIGRASCRERV